MAFSVFGTMSSMLSKKPSVASTVAAVVSPWTTLTGPANVAGNSQYAFSNMNPYNAYQIISSTGQYVYIPCSQTMSPSGGGNYFWYSSDYGTTWTANTTLTDSTYSSCSSGLFGDGFSSNTGACSDSGQYVYFAANSGTNALVFWSSNYGVTFNAPIKIPGVLITCIACNSTGTIVYVSMYNQSPCLYKSTNAGAAGMSFSSLTPSGQKINGLCCSSDGTIIYYGVNTGTGLGLWRSSNSGTSFTQIQSANNFAKVICSSDGSIAYAYNQSSVSNIYKITNSGSTIVQLTNIPVSQTITCDSTGSILWFATTNYSTTVNTIYYSSDGGATAIANYVTTPFTTIANINCNKTGNIVFMNGVNSTSTLGGNQRYMIAASSATAFKSTSITGLKIWFDGADPAGTGIIPVNGASISTWIDKTGSGYNATAGTAGVYNLTSKAITFDGTMYYTTTYPANPTNESVFVVFNATNSSNGNYPVGATNFGRQIGLSSATEWGILSSNRAWSSKVSGFTVNGGTFLGEAFVSSSTNTYTSLNGSLTLTGPNNVAATTFDAGTVTGLGRQLTTGNGVFYGNIMEILIYNSVLSVANRQKIEGYLAWKWSFQTKLPSGHPYYSAAPTF